MRAAAASLCIILAVLVVWLTRGGRQTDKQAFFNFAQQDNKQVNACLGAGGFPIKTWGEVAGTGTMIYRDCRFPRRDGR